MKFKCDNMINHILSHYFQSRRLEINNVMHSFLLKGSYLVQNEDL